MKIFIRESYDAVYIWRPRARHNSSLINNIHNLIIQKFKNYLTVKNTQYIQ